MSLRAESPADAAAEAACDHVAGQMMPAVRDLSVPWRECAGEQRAWWRGIALAAVIACDRAQPHEPHVPLFTDGLIVLRVPVGSRRASALNWWLRRVQRKDAPPA